MTNINFIHNSVPPSDELTGVLPSVTTGRSMDPPSPGSLSSDRLTESVLSSNRLNEVLPSVTIGRTSVSISTSVPDSPGSLQSTVPVVAAVIGSLLVVIMCVASAIVIALVIVMRSRWRRKESASPNGDDNNDDKNSAFDNPIYDGTKIIND